MKWNENISPINWLSGLNFIVRTVKLVCALALLQSRLLDPHSHTQNSVAPDKRFVHNFLISNIAANLRQRINRIIMTHSGLTIGTPSARHHLSIIQHNNRMNLTTNHRYDESSDWTQIVRHQLSFVRTGRMHCFPSCTKSPHSITQLNVLDPLHILQFEFPHFQWSLAKILVLDKSSLPSAYSSRRPIYGIQSVSLCSNRCQTTRHYLSHVCMQIMKIHSHWHSRSLDIVRQTIVAMESWQCVIFSKLASSAIVECRAHQLQRVPMHKYDDRLVYFLQNCTVEIFRCLGPTPIFAFLTPSCFWSNWRSDAVGCVQTMQNTVATTFFVSLCTPLANILWNVCFG